MWVKPGGVERAYKGPPNRALHFSSLVEGEERISRRWTRLCHLQPVESSSTLRLLPEASSRDR